MTYKWLNIIYIYLRLGKSLQKAQVLAERQVEEIMTYIREHHIVTEFVHSNECDADLEACAVLDHYAQENQM